MAPGQAKSFLLNFTNQTERWLRAKEDYLKHKTKLKT